MIEIVEEKKERSLKMRDNGKIEEIKEYEVRSGSRLDPYFEDIKNLIKKGCSIRSAWKITNADMEKPISYTPFLVYVNKYIKKR